MSSVQSRTSRRRKGFRRVRKYFLHYVLLALFCMATAFIMCYTVFFKLDKIKISGCKVYSETQIADEIGAQKGDSLFQIDVSNTEKRLLGELPYLRSVKITRSFPTTLKVTVQEEEVLGAVYTESGFAIFSTTGKVLETQVLSLPEGVPRIVGLNSRTYDTGSYVRESQEKDAQILPQLQSLAVVSEQLKANHFSDITYYDVSDSLNIKVMAEDRLLLKLGTQNDMDYKLEFIRNVLDAKEKGDPEFKNVPEEGVLDFSNPPALHTVSVSMEKVRNEDAYLDFGVELPQQDNAPGGQQSEDLQGTAEGTQPAENGAQPPQEGQTGEATQTQQNGQQTPQAAAGEQQAANGAVQNTAGWQQSPALPAGGQPLQQSQEQAGQQTPPNQPTAPQTDDSQIEQNGAADAQPAQTAGNQNGQSNQNNQNNVINGQPAQTPDCQTGQNGAANAQPAQQNPAGQQNETGQQTQPQQDAGQNNQPSGNVFNAPSRAPIVN